MQLAKQGREIARHTRLVAFNASIEAQRSSDDGGSQAVAVEVRALADRMADNGAQIERLVTELHAHMNTARRAGELSDTSAEELRLELDIRAREALQALLGGLGNALHGSTHVRQASHHLRNLVDDAVVDFQFGDRVSQMLNILGADMQRLAHWLSTHPHPTHEDASHWLAALERSYTMDEQRSQHHGNVHVDRASVVEFF
jgi:methyl-accepting chemotaxis protein